MFRKNIRIFFIACCVVALTGGCAQHSTHPDLIDPALSSSAQPEMPSNSTTQKAVAPSVGKSPKSEGSRKSKSVVRQNQQIPSAAKAPTESRSPLVSYPKVPLNHAFKLKYGETLALPNSDLNFKISKVLDNRCPLEMQCGQSGNAVVTLTIYRNEKRIDVLNVSANNPAAPVIQDGVLSYRFELLELQPYPTVQFMELQHYVAELMVTRATVE